MRFFRILLKYDLEAFSVSRGRQRAIEFSDNLRLSEIVILILKIVKNFVEILGSSYWGGAASISHRSKSGDFRPKSRGAMLGF